MIGGIVVRGEKYASQARRGDEYQTPASAGLLQPKGDLNPHTVEIGLK